jgi:hypothetical protein
MSSLRVADHHHPDNARNGWNRVDHSAGIELHDGCRHALAKLICVVV